MIGRGVCHYAPGSSLDGSTVEDAASRSDSWETPIETWRNTGAHEQFLVLRAAAPDHAKVRRHLNRGDVVLRLREGSDPNELPLANQGHGLFDEGEIVLQTSDSGSPLNDG